MTRSQTKYAAGQDELSDTQDTITPPRQAAKKLSKGPPLAAASSNTSSSTESSLGNSSGSSLSSTKPVGKLRVQVIGAKGLAAQDRNGLADPFVIVNLPGAPPSSSSSSAKKDKDFYRRRTPMQPKTLDPKWKESDSTFEWLITTDWYQSAAADTEAGRSEASMAERNTLLTTPAAEYTESPMVEIVEDPIQAAGSRLLVDSTPTRPSNVRKLSAATGKILSAPVRMTTRGAVATTRAVRKRGPRRPMRIRKNAESNSKHNNNNTLDHHSIIHQANVGSIEFVVWDKDKWSANDYMGECSLPVASWIAEGKSAEWNASEPMILPLVSSRRNAKVRGELMVRIGLVSEGAMEVDEVYHQLVLASKSVEKAGIRSVPADQSVGTTGPSEAFIDYGTSSESEAEDELREDLDSEVDLTDSETGDGGESTTEIDEDQIELETESGSVPLITTTLEPDEGILDPDPGPKTRTKRYLLPRRLRRSPSAMTDVTAVSNAGDDENLSSATNGKKIRVRVRRKRPSKRQESTDSQEPQSQARKTRRLRRKQKKDFAFQAELGKDIIGIVQMEVKGAHDLPRWKNSLGTGFDMDAFVIVSFGQRIFRTRVARHSLNPVWDEKLLFRVRQHESNFVTKLAIYDWDKLSANDFVGSSEIRISELIDAAPKPDVQTGLYGINEDGQHPMKVFQLPLVRNERLEDSRNVGKHTPILTIEAKFTPYDSLRQRFWRQLLMQYDTNDSGTVSNLELTSMLDSLGSTLTSKTIQGLFTQFDKKSEEGDELTVDEAIIALERELTKPWDEKRYVEQGWDATPAGSGSQTPAIMELIATNQAMGYIGPHAPLVDDNELASKGATVPASAMEGQVYSADEKSTASLMDPSLSNGMTALSMTGKEPKQRYDSNASNTSSSPSLSVAMHDGDGGEEEEEQEEQRQVERVIVLKSCPLCHMPRLSKKAEVDIVTHLAVCASQDWRRVDSMMVRNFVTASQAHRKWYTKIITKISQGQYQLGANSANIIVQDRMTGELLEEKMQVYVRLGIRLLYNAARSRMEGARIKKMLKNMSVKQGIKFDSPLSAREIPQFIAFHNLNLDEIKEPLDSFKTFNQFFYRKLKEDARPISSPDDASIMVSSADCRLMAFSSITEATKVWIKGREFTLERLLGEKYKGQLDPYRGGSLVIFRLAPQDYHRFHCPANTIVEDITMITGQYYTVNPMAIRSAIDVYGENIRAVVEFKSKEFGRFFCVCIGAMMVGSINLLIKKGQSVKRGDEMGYYAFGGSTNVCIFEEGRVAFDDDLLANSRTATETLVQVNTRIGKATNRTE